MLGAVVKKEGQVKVNSEKLRGNRKKEPKNEVRIKF